MKKNTPQHKNTTYQNTLNYLYTRQTTPHNNDPNIKTKNLHKIKKLCKILNQPQKKIKSIHIAGTNGKGSTSHALAAILQAAGYQTGLYTSPHLIDFTERIRLNGLPITQNHVTTFIHQHKKTLNNLQPTFFEITLALALNYFAQKKVDLAIIEVGLGGRLDPTNILLPQISIITNISIDHTQILGNTLQQITHEKAGIIKPHTPIIISEYQQQTAPYFDQIAKKQHTQPTYPSLDYQINLLNHHQNHLVVNVKKKGKTLFEHLTLEGSALYQIKNLPGILSAIDLLNQQHFTIKQSAIRKGLANIKKSTGLMGRWQTISTNPTIILDAAHNLAGINQVVKQLKTITYSKLHIILSMTKKPMEEILNMLKLLPTHAFYHLVPSSTPRSIDPKILALLASKLNLTHRIYQNVHHALTQTQQNITNPKEIILITGSIYTLGEVLSSKKLK